MKNLWRVAQYEYQRNVFKKSFIFVLLSVPLFIAFSIAMGVTIDRLQKNDQPVGYVDLAGVLQEDLHINDRKDSLAFVAYPSEQAARQALNDGSIQAAYILPVDYLETRQVHLLYLKEPGENVPGQFFDFLQVNILSGLPDDIAQRVAGGSNVTVRSVDGHREVPAGGPTLGLMLPLFITMGFLTMIMMSSGYTIGAVADEKENRTMEVLVTSISSDQLIAGKIMGITLISFTLLLSWTVVVILGIWIARQFGIAWFEQISIDWYGVIAIILVAIPAYILAIALMTAVGAMATTTQEGQSISALFFILHLAPLYISWSFVNTPHGPLPTLLSLLPFTALMTIGMRNLFSIVPTWQILLSVAIQIVCAIGAVWLAGRALRLGLLRYGQRLSWQRVLGLNRAKGG